MAVQAQYPANIFRSTMKNNVLDHHQQHDLYDHFHHITPPPPPTGNVIGNTYNSFGKQQSNLINGGGVLSGDYLAAESELTCNLSASRKRNRLDSDHHYQNIMPPTLHQSYLHLQQQNDLVLLEQQQQQNFRYSNKLQQINIGGSSNTGISTINYEETNNHRLHQHHESAGTSTSGRSSVLTSTAPMGSQQDHLLMSSNHHRLLHHQNLEIDALILLHNEKLRSVIEETQKRQCRWLVSAVEEQVLKRLAEKETELQNAGRKNAELEEKLKQLNAENQVWFNVAKNNEAIASSLKSTLQQILLQNSNCTKSGGVELLLTANHDQKEGFGDSDGLVIQGLDDDAQSRCYGGKNNQEDKKVDTKDSNKGMKKCCKVCEKNEVSVLVLPCRHLCLCKECESKLDYCPICKAAKNANIHVLAC